MNNTLQLAEQFGLEISPQLRSMMEIMDKSKQDKEIPVKKNRNINIELKKLVSENKFLKQQLLETISILKNLALALGACPDCWGTEADCKICAGRGNAGFTIPEETMFEKMIRPALNKNTSINHQN